MSNSRPGQYETRPLLDIIAEAVAVLRQDLGEYGYIALFGAVPATLAVVVPGVVGRPIALAFMAPLLVIVCVATFAASCAAFGSATNHLQPDAGSAYAAAARRAFPLLKPWLLLVVALWTASYVAATFVGYIDPVPHVVVPLVLIVVSAFYAFPRSLSASAMFDQDLSSREAVAASAAIVRMQSGRVALAWGLALVPAIVVGGMGMLAGFDTINASLAAFFFAGAMPFAAAMMSLLFSEAATQIELAPAAGQRVQAMPHVARRRA